MKIICTNSKGDNLTVQYAFPYYYVSCDGLMTYNTDIATATPYIPGEIYQGSHNPKRNLVLTFAVRHRDYWNVRDLVFSVFSNNGIFTWYPETGEARSIEYYTESVSWSDPNSRGFRYCTVSLICPYPFFSGETITVNMSYWTNNILLPGVFQPFTLGDRISEQIIEIENLQPISIGYTVTFTAKNGDVSNPSLENITTGESFILDVAMASGSVVKVCTVNGIKRVWSPEDPQPPNPWDYELNNWWQIAPGINQIRYDAYSGVGNLDVSIEYAQLYIGG